MKTVQKTFCRWSLITGLLALGFISPSLAGTNKFVVIARTGDIAINLPEKTNRFRSFSAPILNNSGHLAFYGSLNWIPFLLDTTNDDGIWAGRLGALRLVAREGDPVSGLPGVYYQSFSALRLDEAGNVAFAATLKGTNVTIDNDTALLAEINGSVILVAREGDPAPGLENGVYYGDLGLLNTLNFVIGRPGEVAFRSPLTGNVGFTNNQAVWCGSNQAVKAVAREGSPAPLPDARLVFNGLVYESLAFNPAGLLCFSAPIKTNGTGFASDCIWVGMTNGLSLVGQSGLMSSPLSNAPFTDFSAVTLSAQLQYCFVGTIKTGSFTNDSVIVSGSLSNLVIAAREGSQAPHMPSGVLFGNLALVKPILGGGGHVAFATTVSGPSIGSTNSTAIWAGLPNSPIMVCRRGSPAVGLPEGVVYSTSFAGTFDLVGINNQGHIAYISNIEGPGVTGENDQALWAGLPGFENLLLRRGDYVDLGDGQPRKVFTIDMVDQKGELQVSGGQDGRSRSLNDLNEYIIHVTFVAGQGEALLFVPSVVDPDQNGLASIVEKAYGLAENEPVINIRPKLAQRAGQLTMAFRRNTLATNVSLVIQKTGSLNGIWENMPVVSTLDADQSGLPVGVERRQTILTNEAAEMFFYRVVANPVLP